MNTSRRRFLAGSLGLGVLSLTGCAQNEQDEQSEQASEPKTSAKIVFADAASPPSLDPATTTDLVTARITGQILEGLVRADSVTGVPVPQLATDWTMSPDGLSCVFTLRDGVVFHDGTSLDAEAVAANFRRWKQMAQDEQTPSSGIHSLYAPTVGGEQTVYADCVVVDDRHIRLELHERYVPLLTALTQSAFGLLSPASWHDETLVTEHPVGTGPFRLDSWEQGTVTLKRSESYWDDLAQIHTLDFRAVPDTERRYFELVRGGIDAYEQVGTGDFVALARRSLQVQQRDPYAVAYLSMNLNHELLANLNMRRAVTRSIDRSSIAQRYFPKGTKVADDFTPALFQLHGEGTHGAYRRDTEEVRRLLNSLGYHDEPLEFWYPTGVDLPYLQRPEAIYAEISADLAAAGLNIAPRPIPWSEGYLEQISTPSSTRALALSGVRGAYRDPAAFIGRIFDAPGQEFGLEDQHLVTMIRRTATITDNQQRSEQYRKINEYLASQLIAVPLVYPISAVAIGPRLGGYSVSSTGVEDFGELKVLN